MAWKTRKRSVQNQLTFTLVVKKKHDIMDCFYLGGGIFRISYHTSGSIPAIFIGGEFLSRLASELHVTLVFHATYLTATQKG